MVVVCGRARFSFFTFFSFHRLNNFTLFDFAEDGEILAHDPGLVVTSQAVFIRAMIVAKSGDLQLGLESKISISDLNLGGRIGVASPTVLVASMNSMRWKKTGPSAPYFSERESIQVAFGWQGGDRFGISFGEGKIIFSFILF
jgi:hypothetical protein